MDLTTPFPESHERRVELLLLAVVSIWALNAPFVKYGLGGLDIWVFNGIRFTVASLLLLGIFLWRNTWVPVIRSDWPKLIGLGLLGNFFYQLFYIFGLNITTAGNSAVLLATSPLWTALLSAWIHKGKVFPQQWFGMLASFVGIAMIIIGSGKKLAFGSEAIVGDLLSLGAAILWGLNTNLLKPLLSRYSAMQISVVTIGVGAVCLIVAALPDAMAHSWSSVEPVFYAIPVVSGAFSNAIAVVLFSYGIKIIGPSRAANYSNLIPVIAFVAAYLTLHEEISLIQVIGAGVTVAGVWIARR